MALQTAPSKKLSDMSNAMEMEPKYSLSFDEAGISLQAYMKNSPMDVRKAYLKMVPY
jgi:hypothetical protein